MTNSEEAQKRHADALRSVEGLVENANVELADVNLKSEDIAKALERNAASTEAQQRGMMAIQYFLASVAAGGIEDREQGLKMLETSFKEMGATLPSQLLQGTSLLLPSTVRDSSSMVSGPGHGVWEGRVCAAQSLHEAPRTSPLAPAALSLQCACHCPLHTARGPVSAAASPQQRRPAGCRLIGVLPLLRERAIGSG